MTVKMTTLLFIAFAFCGLPMCFLWSKPLWGAADDAHCVACDQ